MSSPTQQSQQGYPAFRVRTMLTMVPGSPPLDDAVLILDQGVIQEVTSWSQARKEASLQIQDLGPSLLVPGLINAHTHLELSHLQGQTILGQGFLEWVKSLIRLPLKGIDQATLADVTRSLQDQGTVCVGDISGHCPGFLFDVLNGSGLSFHLFLERLGFAQPGEVGLVWPKGLDPENQVHLSPAGHALYSTHPRTLQRCKEWCARRKRPFSLHLAEHAGETELLETGRGEFAEFLYSGLLPESFAPPGVSPVQYADRLGLLDEQTLAVHLVHLSRADINLLAARDVTACLCPRSNAAINVGRAPAEQLLGANIPICLATDSLSSNSDLDLWSEAAFFIQNLQREISLQELVSMLTRIPAGILGFEGSLGTLEKGKAGRFALVPEGLRDLL